MPMRPLHAAWLTTQDALSVSPALALPLARVRRLRDYDGLPITVGADTEIVIEGYPRSGNTFAVAAFRLAQRRPVRIAHHLHAAAQVLAGVRRGLPVMVLLREPESAVLSVAVKDPSASIRWALRSYVRFHRAVASHRSGFVIAPFDRVRADFGRVIRSVNDRFGTAFAEFVHTEPNLSAVLDSVERRGEREARATGRSLERAVGRPSPERDRAKEALRESYLDERHAALRREAEALFERLGG